jgi:hypothetical protein
LTLVSVRGAVASSDDYQLTAIGLDAGGGHSSSAGYGSDVSFGLTVGRSVVGNYANTLGFVGQFNNPPKGADDLRSHAFDQPVDILIPALLANDSDPDYIEEILTLHTFDLVTEAGGSVTFVPPFLRYVPPLNFRGTDYFDYTLLDPDGDFDTATVAVVSVPASTLKPNALTMVKLEDGNYLVRFQGAANATQFIVYTKDNLNTTGWATLLVMDNGGDGLVEFIVDPKADKHRYFQIQSF